MLLLFMYVFFIKNKLITNVHTPANESVYMFSKKGEPESIDKTYPNDKYSFDETAIMEKIADNNLLNLIVLAIP